MHESEWAELKKHLGRMRKSGMPADATQTRKPEMPKPEPGARGRMERFEYHLAEMRKRKNPVEAHLKAMEK